MKFYIIRMRLRLRSGGSAIIEAVIGMLLICMILFGLLQIFYYSAAQMVADYAAFRAARSETVGFNDEKVSIEGKLKAISASGRMRFPFDMTKGTANENATSAVGQFYYERLAIIDYMENRRRLAYEYWNTNYNTSKTHETYLTVKSTSQGNTFTENAVFTDYPWIMPFRKAFVTDGQIDIEGTAKMSRHSVQYLE